MPVVIPPELARGLLPRRPEDAGKPKRVTPTTAWERVREDAGRFARGGESGIAVAFVLGEGAAPEELRPRMKACASILEETTPPRAWSLEAASTLLSYLGRSFDALESTMGLAFALEARLDSLRYEAKWGYTNGVACYSLRLRDSVMASDTSLRPRVLLATPEVRAACKAVAERAWPNATPGQKLTLAYSFFEEEAWAHEVARTFIDDEAAAKGLPIEALFAIVRDREVMQALIQKRRTSRSYLEVVASLGDQAFELVAEVFTSPRDDFDLKHAAATLAVFDDPRAAALLASGLGSIKVRPSMAELCVRFPQTGRTALEPLAKGKGRLAKLATELLGAIANTEASSLAQASTADGEENAGANGVTERPDRAEEAGASELPWILVRPPWLDRKKLPKRKPPRLALEMLPREEHVSLSDTLVQAAREAVDPSAPTFRPEGPLGSNASLTRDGARLDDDAILAHWDAGSTFAAYHDNVRLPDVAAYLFHRFGTKAIPGLVLSLEKSAFQHKADKTILFGIDSPRIAMPLAALLDDDRTYQDDGWGPYARRWLATHPETAVIGLVPGALAGSPHAERALRWLSARCAGGPPVDVLALARPYGADAVKALEELLAWDARLDLPPRLSMPSFFRPESLSRPLLRNGKRLPLSAVEHLGTMLSFTRHPFVYAGIADVKTACEPRSLAEFAWDLAKAWEISGGKSATAWMVGALVHLADDEVVRRTTPAMRSQAVGGVLQSIGTDSAVMELITIAARAASGNKGYAWAATAIDRRIHRIAAERGMSGEELEDSVLPLSEVDYKGFQLDYGPRLFEVRFDERLEAFIVGEEGAKLRTLPPARKTDDKTKVERARRVWQDLREEVSAVVARRLVSLERAMIRGKTWTPSELVRRYVAHPLLGHLGRALVWSQSTTTFRVTEDGAFADVADHPVTLDPDAPVRLAHPARMPDSEAKAWRQLLFDYRIVQPFAQLDRPARPLSSEQLAERVFVRTPRDLAHDAFARRLSERGYLDNKKRLSRGVAHVTSTFQHQSVATITLKLVPAFVDFDPVEMSEVLSDIDV